MGRTIESSKLGKTPVVLLKEKKGSKFIGTKVKQKVNPKNKDGFIFEFSADGGDAMIGLPTGNKVVKNGRACSEYAEATIEEGAKVAIYGDAQLNDKLAQVEVGEQVSITFNEVKINESNGHTYNDYTVEVL